ncbi:MAG: hypothetical protein Q7K45_07380 [Nanoarchaeota archaeon]|nr:hypothetical protein [Nanoarchaeota archaeon]
MMKTKSVTYTIAVIVLMVFLAGCLDYKAYDTSKETKVDDASLVDEIANIEEQLNASPTAAVVVEENFEEVVQDVEELNKEVEQDVVLPDLGEDTEKVVVEESLDTISVNENELVRLNVKVSDPDKDTVTYTYSKPLNEKGEWQTHYGDAGEYIVTITASDGRLTTEKKVKLAVERVNVAPIIETLLDINVREGETIIFEPEVSDPNKDKVTVTVSEPLKSGNWKTDHTSAGEYQIKVTATDGELETEQMFNLLVEDVNVLPEISGLLETISIKEGESVSIKPTVTDLDNDPITVTISDPVGNDGAWDTSYTDHGTYLVTVTVSDGKDTIVKKVNVQVADVNQAPVFEDVSIDKS